ncbi:membrane bound O-acyl transferase family-domain-containing protein [Aspergillus varians]
MSLDNIPPWFPPVLYWNLIQAITGLTATFTPSQSPLRPAIATITAVLAYLLQSNIQTHFSGTRPSGPVVAMCWVNVLNAIDLLLLTRASYEAQLVYTTTKHEKKDTNHNTTNPLLTKILFALILPYNYRRINTPWQISRLPRFSSKDPSYIPTKSTFLLRSTIKLLIAASLIQILTLDPSDPHLSKALTYLDQSKSVLLFHNATLYSVLLQARFTLSFGLVTRAAIVAGYTAGSVFAVLLGSDPASWPPIAGSLMEAWTLKRLWGQSWHQTLRRPLTSNTIFLSTTLGLSPTSTAAHWIRVVIAFLGSGTVHALMDMGFGVPFAKSGGVVFYALQILGLVMESSALAVADRIGLSSVLGHGVKRGVGYVWVCVFLLWSTPVWINPILISLWGDGTRVMSPWLGFR